MSSNISFNKIEENEIPILSKLATDILREHFDPIIGKAQNDYMLEKYQSIPAIQEQFKKGYLYFWVKYENHLFRKEQSFVRTCGQNSKNTQKFSVS